MKKYFIDTNYFLRLFLKDNKRQFDKVYSLFQEGIDKKVFLYTSLIVFFEIYWVLSSFYKLNKKKIIWYLERILKMDFVEIESRQVLIKTLNLYKKRNIDFEDCYNVVYFKEKRLSNFASFDKKILGYLKKL